MKVHCPHDKMVPIGELIPHPKNPNVHSDDQIERLAKILEYQGWRYPIKVCKQSGFITSGHGRLLAATKLGLKKVPVSFQDYESEEQMYADLVSDNAIASWAELKLADINIEIPNLGPDFDIDLLGIKNFKIDVAENEGLTDPDAIPENAETRVKPGDVWILGDHRLMCGDSTVDTDMQKLMNGKKAEITFTSPPYNLGNNAKLRGYNGDGKDSAYEEKTDHKTQAEYLQFLIDFTNSCISYSDIAFINIQLLAGNKIALPEYWHHFRGNIIDVMVWDKEHAQTSAARRVLNSVWEFIFAVTLKECPPSRSIFTGEGFRGNVDNIYRLNPNGKKEDIQKGHGAVFPVQFVEHFVQKFSKGSVLDPFGGTGTTLITCEKNNRCSFNMEISPKYCDIVLTRWEKFTGKAAVLQQ